MDGGAWAGAFVACGAAQALDVEPQGPSDLVTQIVSLDGGLALQRIAERGRNPSGDSRVVRHRQTEYAGGRMGEAPKLAFHHEDGKVHGKDSALYPRWLDKADEGNA